MLLIKNKYQEFRQLDVQPETRDKFSKYTAWVTIEGHAQATILEFTPTLVFIEKYNANRLLKNFCCYHSE